MYLDWKLLDFTFSKLLSCLLFQKKKKLFIVQVNNFLLTCMWALWTSGYVC